MGGNVSDDNDVGAGFDPEWVASSEAAAASTRGQRVRVPPRPPQQEGEELPEDKGIKLGLGDFIFYSILV